MLKFVICVLCAAEFRSVVDAATAFIAPVQVPEKFAFQIGCYLEEFDQMIAYNQSIYPVNGKSCQKYTCEFDNYIIMETCLKGAFEGKCKYVEGNLTVPYPHCCGRYDCKTKLHVEENLKEDIEKANDDNSIENSTKADDKPVENDLNDGEKLDSGRSDKDLSLESLEQTADVSQREESKLTNESETESNDEISSGSSERSENSATDSETKSEE